MPVAKAGGQLSNDDQISNNEGEDRVTVSRNGNKYKEITKSMTKMM